MAKFLLIPIFITVCLLYFISPPKTPILSPLVSDRLSPPPPAFSPTPTQAPSVILGLVGDLGLGRHITSTARNKKNFNWSFEFVSPWLLENDFTLANLESPIIQNCPEGKTGTFTFCGDSQFLPYLSKYKFIFNLANNHILNYGSDGLVQTHNYLNQYQITFTPEFSTKTINGIIFGFLGFDFISYPDLSIDTIIDQVKRHDPEVDWLIVSLHWGNEYLTKAENWRLKLGHSLIDAGADIVHGHHPHVWQEYEIYQNKPIFYSFGNFIFDQSWSYATSHSQIVRLTLTKTEIKDLKLFPIEINFNSQPKILQ